MLPGIANCLTKVYYSRPLYSSSYASELEAILLALHHAPRHNRLPILSDNQAAILQVQSLLKGRTSLFRSVFASILREIQKALHSRHAPTHIAYIPAHVGFAGNTLADSVANWASWLPITQAYQKLV